MQIVEGKELMVVGDRFKMRRDEWDWLTCPGPRHPSPISKAEVECEVLRVYARSHYELRYLCRKVGDRAEFVLAQFLEDAYTVSVKAENLQVSRMVFVEAAGRLGVRPISEFLPNCYSREDAEAIALHIQNMPLIERYGYLVPASEGD